PSRRRRRSSSSPPRSHSSGTASTTGSRTEAALVAEPVARPAPLLRVSGLRIEYVSGATRRTLVADLDLEVREGETIAIVGESGSGKSLSARAIVGLLPARVEATAGEVRFEGRDLLRAGRREQ